MKGTLFQTFLGAFSRILFSRVIGNTPRIGPFFQKTPPTRPPTLLFFMVKGGASLCRWSWSLFLGKNLDFCFAVLGWPGGPCEKTPLMMIPFRTQQTDAPLLRRHLSRFLPPNPCQVFTLADPLSISVLLDFPLPRLLAISLRLLLSSDVFCCFLEREFFFRLFGVESPPWQSDKSVFFCFFFLGFFPAGFPLS